MRDVVIGIDALRAQEAAIKAVCAALEPESIPLEDIPSAYASVVAMGKALAGAQLRLARRVDESKVSEREGAADTAEYLARTSGTSIGAARDTLTTSKRAQACPKVETALANGELSAPQASIIADAAAVDPDAAGELLQAARRSSLAELRDQCGRVKARNTDMAETERRVHSRRSLREYVDTEGAWHLHATGTVADGSKISAALRPIIDCHFNQARRQGKREERDAYAFDALVEMAERATGTPAEPSAAGRPPSVKHLGLIRVDFDALRRGCTQDDETCEIAGLGPISVAAARDLLGDAVLKLVITRGADVVNITHLGRGLNAAQQIAQWWLQPTCTTLGCPRRGFLENDHRVPYADCRLTRLDNNDPLCPHCHDLKTYQGWALIEGTGKRALVPPTDPRHPSNANAPPESPAA